MNICIVVPSSGYLLQAGVRIRYERISTQLLKQDVTLNFKVIDDFVGSTDFKDDIYIISKVYDFRAVILAVEISSAGKLVGPDLFDDYFSNLEDFRFTRLRRWLSELAKFSNFALCSTKKIKSRLESYFDDVPMHVLNDPADIEPEELQEVLALVDTKQSEFALNQELRVLWFGIGDNPHFDVGIQDLVRYAPQVLRKLKKAFPNIKLTLLTNHRALTVDAYEMLKRLPIEYDLQFWTEEKECLLLGESTVALLPVNFQNFSTVKSFNRAVTALAKGSQVLSLGYDLYEPLHSIIYRNVEELIVHLTSSSLKFSLENEDLIKSLFAEFASASNETCNLINFLKQLGPTTARVDDSVKLINLGSNLDKKLYKFAINYSWVCVSSPALGKQANYVFSIVHDKDGKLSVSIGKGAQKFLLDIQNRTDRSVSSNPIQDKLQLSDGLENIFNSGENSFFYSNLYKQSLAVTESVVDGFFENYILLNAETSKSFFAY